jgi:hypothetical protein
MPSLIVKAILTKMTIFIITNLHTVIETLLALVRDLFTFSSKVIKRFIIV